jgi:hypothetical protein
MQKGAAGKSWEKKPTKSGMPRHLKLKQEAGHNQPMQSTSRAISDNTHIYDWTILAYVGWLPCLLSQRLGSPGECSWRYATQLQPLVEGG